MRAELAFVPLAVVLLAGPAAAGPTKFATLVADRDNTLYEPDKKGVMNSNGAGIYMFAGRTASFGIRRAVVRFDVAGALPEGAKVLNATLVLHASRAFPFGVDTAASLHRLTADWGEGTSDAGDPGGYGTEATDGDATWEHTFFSGETWAESGGDYVGAISANAPVPRTGFAEFASTETAADAQGWLDDPGQNFGWIVRGDEKTEQSARRFDTRENPVEEYRPRLMIEYTEGCAADFDGDGFVTGLDYDLYVQAFEAGDLAADFDGDGFLTGIDFDLYVLAFEAGC